MGQAEAVKLELQEKEHGAQVREAEGIFSKAGRGGSPVDIFPRPLQQTPPLVSSLLEGKGQRKRHTAPCSSQCTG